MIIAYRDKKVVGGVFVPLRFSCTASMSSVSNTVATASYVGRLKDVAAEHDTPLLRPRPMRRSRASCRAAGRSG
jgi:hypothetical protein